MSCRKFEEIMRDLEQSQKEIPINFNHQWNGVLGVLKVQRAKLDLDYLETWAKELSVSGLLERAIKEMGITAGYPTP